MFLRCASRDIEPPEFTCNCYIVVSPSDPIVTSDYCNSCGITALDSTSINFYYDCSNKLLGVCSVVDPDHNCRGFIPVPVPAPTPPPWLAPVNRPFPTFGSSSAIPANYPSALPSTSAAPSSSQYPSSRPISEVVKIVGSRKPTLNPMIESAAPIPTTSETPVGTTAPDRDAGPTTTGQESTSTGNEGSGPSTLVFGVVIGLAGGCFLLAVFAASLVLCRKRNDQGSTIESSKISPLNRHIIESNTADDSPPQRRSLNEPNDVPDSDNSLRKKEKSYPVNHAQHVKDQCRSVVARPLSFRTSTTTTLPIAFAVSTTNTTATTATITSTFSLDQPARPTCSSTET